MHDPMTVAWEIVRPWPKCHNMTSPRKRWEFRYRWARWWVPWEGWMRFWVVFGVTLYWPPLVTVWHVEPNNRDTRPHPCGTKRWRWHVHHWRVRIIPWRDLRHRFDRCGECGRRMNKAVRIGVGWHDRRVIHRECSELRQRRAMCTEREHLIRQVFAAYRLAADVDEPDALERLRRLPDADGLPHSGFRMQRGLEKMLGWDRDDKYRLVRSGGEDRP